MDEYGTLIEPPKVGFTFGAPGWWVVAALWLILLLRLTRLAQSAYRRNAYRRQAIKTITALQIQHVAGARLLYDINMLLKCVAMQVYGRTATAALRPAQWLDFLNTTGPSALFEPQDNMLLQSMYSGIDAGQADDFVRKAKAWMKKHKPIKTAHRAL